MEEIFNKISDLLKQETFQYDYDYYFMSDGLRISLNKDIKDNSLYQSDFLYDDNSLYTKDGSVINKEEEKFIKYKKDNNLSECMNFYEYNSVYRITVYNNIYSSFILKGIETVYYMNDIITIKNLDALLHFTKTYTIPAIHKIETCSEFLKENHHFMHKKLKEEIFFKTFISEVRAKRIEMFEETKK